MRFPKYALPKVQHNFDLFFANVSIASKKKTTYKTFSIYEAVYTKHVLRWPGYISVCIRFLSCFVLVVHDCLAWQQYKNMYWQTSYYTHSAEIYNCELCGRTCNMEVLLEIVLLKARVIFSSLYQYNSKKSVTGHCSCSSCPCWPFLRQFCCKSKTTFLGSAENNK